nr:hypothetical protein [Candidatus Baldrarchaeota archaeon]
MGEEKEALELVEEYLREVRSYLPEESAEDIIEELRTHIMDKAEEMGGLTVKNVYRIIKDLGDPRELASRYVVGGEKRKLRFELGVSEDIYPYFIQMVFWISLLLVIGYTIKIICYVYSAGSLVTVFDILSTFVNMMVSIALTILFLYVFMSFISSNPDLKEMFRSFLKDIFGEKKTGRKEKEKKIKSFEKKIEEKVRRCKSKIKSIGTSASSSLIGGIIAFIVAYVIYIYLFTLPFNWLMQIFILVLIFYIIADGILSISHFFYISYTEKKSYTINVVSSIISLIFVPWLILANIFTEEIQIPIIDIKIFETEDYGNFLKYLRVIPIPPEYIFLAKLLTLLLLIVVIVNAIIVLLRYTRTAPKKQ